MMAFRQQSHYVAAGMGDDMRASQYNGNPNKRKHPAVGQFDDVPRYCTSGGTNWEAEIHHFEKDAYTAVLRAFKIQSDSISWEKECLMTNLRLELRLTNDEHREILCMLNKENCYQWIRELRQANGDRYAVIGSSNMSYNVVPDSIAKGPSQKQSKKHSAVPHPSLGLSSAFNQQSSLAEGQKLLFVQNCANVAKGSTNPVKHPSSDPNETGTNGTDVSSTIFKNKTSELAKHNYLLGQKVKIRLPDDHNFYDAVISRCNPAQGLHALSFNVASGIDDPQWVDLAKIPPCNILWDNEAPELTTLPHSFRLSYNSRTGGGILIRKSRPKSNSFNVPGESGHGRSEIKIRVTADLVETVKRVFRAGKVDSNTIGYVKEALKDHEKALIKVLESLADDE